MHRGGETLGAEIGDIPWLTYSDAMHYYGTDKPDLRFGLQLTDLTEYFCRHALPGVPGSPMLAPSSCLEVRISPAEHWTLGRSGQSSAGRGLAYVLFTDDGPTGPVAKNLRGRTRRPDGRRRASVGDCAFFAAGKPGEARGLLGAARLEIGARLNLIDESEWSFVWVVDAPMFEQIDVDGGTAWTAVHHPFTSPNDEWLDRFAESPGEALASAYDPSATATRSAAAPSVSIGAISRPRCSTSWACPSRRPRNSSASCSRPSTTVHRPTVVSPSAGTGSACCSRGQSPYGRSSPSEDRGRVRSR